MVVLDAAIHESFAQKAACPLESVDASYPNKVGAGQSELDLESPDLERQTYSEKRKFWEDISRKHDDYQRSESEISRTSQLTINESDSESCLPNVSEGDGTTEGISDVMRSETIEDINVPDISECSVAEKAHYFEEQIQKEMAKGTPRVHQQDSSKSEKSLFKVKADDDQRSCAEKSTMEMTKEKIDIEEKHVAESREIEKILKTATEGDKWTKESWKDRKDKKKKDDKEVREEVKKITTQPVMEICKELLNKERELAEETRMKYIPVAEEIATKKPDISTDVVQEIVGKERSGMSSKEKLAGKQIVKEETTIMYKMQKDHIMGDVESSRRDIRTELYPLDDKKEIEQFLEEERRIIEEEAKMQEKKMMAALDKERKSSIDTEIKQMKKESRIPISTSMADKDKSQKEGKGKILPEKPEEKLIKSSLIAEKEKDIASPSSKKKEFESRIPKRIMEGATTKEKEGTKKDLPGRKDSETITFTERKSSEEVTSRHEEHSTTKSKTQTFSKTFTDAQDAFKMFENISAMKDKDFGTVTSKIDTKATSKVEKKEVFSSEIASGTDKFITHEEKEKVERKKSSESKLTKESLAETTEEKRSKSKETDKSTVQKMSMNVTEGKKVIDASASESKARNEKEELFKLLEDSKGTAMEKSGTSRDRKRDVDVAIRIKRDDAKKVEDIKELPKTAKVEEIDLGKIEMLTQGQSYRESLENFKVEQFVPSQRDKTDSTTKKTKEDEQFPGKVADRKSVV